MFSKVSKPKHAKDLKKRTLVFYSVGLSCTLSKLNSTSVFLFIQIMELVKIKEFITNFFLLSNL